MFGIPESVLIMGTDLVRLAHLMAMAVGLGTMVSTDMACAVDPKRPAWGGDGFEEPAVGERRFSGLTRIARCRCSPAQGQRCLA